MLCQQHQLKAFTAACRRPLQVSVPSSMRWLPQPLHNASAGSSCDDQHSRKAAGQGWWGPAIKSTSSHLGSPGQTPRSSLLQPGTPSALLPSHHGAPSLTLKATQVMPTTAQGAEMRQPERARRGRCYFVELFPWGVEFSFLCHGHRRRLSTVSHTTATASPRVSPWARWKQEERPSTHCRAQTSSPCTGTAVLPSPGDKREGRKPSSFPGELWEAP